VVLAAAPANVSLHNLALDWGFEPAPVAVLVAALVLYAAGVRRLARGGRRWPGSRTAAFGAGCAVVAVALLSGVAAYDTSRFSVHVVQHLLLSMVAAVLFALSAPVTLALQACSRTTQRRLLRALHSPVVRALTHPFVALALFGGTLFILYFTDLYALSLRHPLLHDLVHIHFLAVGLLFFGLVVGLDPWGRRLPYGLCLLLVLATVPLHAFLGIALLSSSSPLWSAHTLADQQAGAAILWAVGDLVTLVVGGIVLAQWMAYDEREAAREDRLAQSAATGATGRG
jgi:putative copper resistance protein D